MDRNDTVCSAIAFVKQEDSVELLPLNNGSVFNSAPPMDNTSDTKQGVLELMELDQNVDSCLKKDEELDSSLALAVKQACMEEDVAWNEIISIGMCTNVKQESTLAYDSHKTSGSNVTHNKSEIKLEKMCTSCLLVEDRNLQSHTSEILNHVKSEIGANVDVKSDIHGTQICKTCGLKVNVTDETDETYGSKPSVEKTDGIQEPFSEIEDVKHIATDHYHHVYGLVVKEETMICPTSSNEEPQESWPGDKVESNCPETSHGPKIDKRELDVIDTASDDEELPHSDQAQDNADSRSHESTYSCQLCGRQFKKKGFLTNHILKNCKNRNKYKQEFTIVCHGCGVNQDSLMEFKKHLLSCKETPHKSVSCPVCGKVFTQTGNIKQHLLAHTGEKPYKCSKCPKGFSHPSHLKQHALTHSDQKPQQCQVCDKRFRFASDLRRHQRVHSGEKPYGCSICGQWFTQTSHLRLHVLNHKLSNEVTDRNKTTNKLHACSICGKKYTSNFTMKQHELTHSNKKGHACEVCDKAYAYASDLKRHMLSHSDDNPLACKVCKRAFSKAQHLKKHMLSHREKN